MTVEEVNKKLCPFTDTKGFHNCEVNYCIAGPCMAWVYTREYESDNSSRNTKLPENKKEGYCMLINKETG